MQNKPDSPVDTLLDAALKSYLEAEPLNGLENRILNRVSLAHTEKRHRHIRPLLAISATLALSCWLIFTFQHNRQPHSVIRAVAHAEAHSPARTVSSPSPHAHIPDPRPSPQLPKREMFPIPRPPTTEERALLRFVEQDPKQVAQALASVQRQTDAPIEIEPLEIKPLQTDAVSN